MKEPIRDVRVGNQIVRMVTVEVTPIHLTSLKPRTLFPYKLEMIRLGWRVPYLFNILKA